MGLGPSAIKLNLDLWQRGFLKTTKSVIEMGSQEMHMTLPLFEELVRAAGVPGYKKENFTALAHWPAFPRCPARPFYELLGIDKYNCVDMNKMHGAIPLDLNFPLDDKSLYGKFDLVTDYGTNEHVFNTAEAYRTVHRLCKENGLIIVMQAVFRGNGYYGYDHSFFEGIAAANNYKIIFSSYLIAIGRQAKDGGFDEFHVPLSPELLDIVEWNKTVYIGICYVFQKQSAEDFRIPYQGQYLADVQGHHGYQLQFLGTPPSRSSVPIYSLENIPAKTLASTLLRKIQRKIKRKMGINK